MWVGTSKDRIPGGVYEYRFLIDGRDAIDARNPSIKPQRWPNTSILHIPSRPPALWDLQNIPHGTLHRHSYHSKSLGRWRELVIYTPPAAGKDPLPVLYLAHGYSDNQRTWTEHGKAHHILDGLLHAEKASPMIIVMPDAHAIDPEGKNKDTYFPPNTQAFCDDLIDDIIPFVEEHYPTSKERAFAGLSMGGCHALTIALRHSDKFSHVGAFSALPPKLELPGPDEAKRINQQLSLLWIACGDRDFLFERNQAFDKRLTEHGIDKTYVITKGDAHSWPVWRNYLIEFLPMLFK